jgi:hypothetical protein
MVRRPETARQQNSADQSEMSDIFQEVDEDIRREQLRKLWDRFGPYVLAAAVLIVVATAGYKGWEYWQARQAAATGDRFLAALQLANDGKHDDALKAFEAISKDGSGGYPALAHFRVATEKALSNDRSGAIADFDALAKDPGASADIKAMARLRAALLTVDDASFADIQSRIGDLATVGNPWRQSAREILGLSAWRAGDYVTSRKYFDQIAYDVGTSKELRERAGIMLSLIAAKIGPEPAPATGAAPATAAPAGGAATPAAPATPTP